jgi:hypothetical protein
MAEKLKNGFAGQNKGGDGKLPLACFSRTIAFFMGLSCVGHWLTPVSSRSCLFPASERSFGWLRPSVVGFLRVGCLGACSTEGSQSYDLDEVF